MRLRPGGIWGGCPEQGHGRNTGTTTHPAAHSFAAFDTHTPPLPRSSLAPLMMASTDKDPLALSSPPRLPFSFLQPPPVSSGPTHVEAPSPSGFLIPNPAAVEALDMPLWCVHLPNTDAQCHGLHLTHMHLGQKPS